MKIFKLREKISIKTILFVCSLFSILSLSAQIDFPQIEQYKLKNGLEVTWIPYGSLSVTNIHLYTNAGTKNETPGLQDIASITAEAMLWGNAKYSRQAQDNAISAMGATLTAGSNTNFSSVNIQFLNKDQEKAVDLFASAVLSPTFPAAELKELINQKVTYSNPRKMDITQLGEIFSDLETFGTMNPIGRSSYEKQLTKLDSAKIREFYQFSYAPKNCKLVICGKPDDEKLKSLIQKSFGKWEAKLGEMNSSSYDLPEIKDKFYAVLYKTKATQAWISWTKKAPMAGTKEMIPFELANSVFNNIIFREIREKAGKTYGIYSQYNEAANSGIFRITTQVRAAETYNTIALFDSVLKSFCENGITETQLQVAKAKFRGSYLGMDSPAQISSFFNPMIYSDLSKRKSRFDEMEMISTDVVNKIIKKYYTATAYKIVVVGDEMLIREQVERLPGLQKLAFTDIEKDE